MPVMETATLTAIIIGLVLSFGLQFTGFEKPLRKIAVILAPVALLALALDFFTYSFLTDFVQGLPVVGVFLMAVLVAFLAGESFRGALDALPNM